MAEESQELKDAGLKITLPRIKILQILDSAEVHHVSAEDVYKILLNNGEEIGLATVYRVLTQFEQAGLVVRHNFEGGHSVFEMSSEKHHAAAGSRNLLTKRLRSASRSSLIVLASS